MAAPTDKWRKNARSEVRLSQSEKDVLIEAAGLSRMSVSDFVRSRAVSDAEDLVRRHHQIRLPDDAHTAFMAALDSSSANDRWNQAVRRARPLKLQD